MDPSKHSGLGVASLVMSSVGALGLVMVFAIAAVLGAAAPAGMDEDGAPAMLLGCCVFLLAGLCLLAIGIAIGDLVRAKSAKTMPILALAISGGAIGLSLFLTLLGLTME
jgi:hypothetical protein